MNKFFEPSTKVDHHDPNREELEFLDRIRKIIDLITLMDERQGEVELLISKDCAKHLKDLKLMYESLLDIDPRELPEVRMKIDADARKLYHSLD